ncbi:MAG TPA: hypothetical protein VFX70_17935 [Mycobacteriales bacterium]|nr:hypothetical protein [Mycobacteriales bacterium]
MIAGSAAIVTGVATATIGLLASPALANGPVSYECTGTSDTNATAVDITLGGNVSGTVSGAPKVGDAVTLGGFQLTLSGTDQALVGVIDHITSTSVTAAVTDNNTPAESATPALSIDTAVGADGSLSFTTPAGPADLTGFTAQAAGPLTFSIGDFDAALNLSLNGTQVDTVTVHCAGGGTVASVTVVAAPPPTTSAPPTTSTGGKHHPKPPHSNSPAPTGTAPAQNTNTGTATTNTTSARPTLASTGVPYTIPMSAGGAALVLLGAGMLLAARRRHDPLLDGPAGLDGSDGPSSAEADTEV